MPFLMVNLDDEKDCRTAIKQLRGVIGKEGPDGGGCEPRGRGKHRGGRHGGPGGGGPGGGGPGGGGLGGGPGGPRGEDVADLPLPQKLRRIKQRQIWKHLVGIAEAGDNPRSLPELDAMLDLRKNKMRSLKAIMAKLENRFGVKFLRVAHDAGVDASGNPRYEMPKNVRRQILKIESASDD